ncbi:eukaryotic translation initiation factor [Aureococcus anophagefferens]|nr:eukaryotic translation initiation factor [Aureococcus anophagefferens]
MGDVEGFETADAGASETIPMEAGQIRKGGYICIKNRPCKVVSVSTSKTGKHGHAKCNFVATDIFTGKKLEDIVPPTHAHDGPQRLPHGVHAPRHLRRGLPLLMDESGEAREDLQMPKGPDELVKSIREGFDAGDSLSVVVVKAMGEEHVMSCKKDTSA